MSRDSTSDLEGAATGPLRWLRRGWWIVLLVTVVATGAVFFTTSSAPTTYTGRASLIVNSNNRAPEQDAVLVQGYVEYFNNAAYQTDLLEQAGVDSDVTLVATAAASSPIMLVQATASSPEGSQSAAADVAEAFAADINSVRDGEQEAQVADLEARIDALTDAGGADAPASIAALQDQIAQVTADRTNRLQELDFAGGVTVDAPAVVTSTALAAVGGLVVGVLLALGIGRLREGRRRPAPADLPAEYVDVYQVAYEQALADFNDPSTPQR